MNKKAVIKTKEGFVLIEFSEKGLVSLKLPCKKKPKFFPVSKDKQQEIVKRLKKDLNQYFDGKKIDFDYPLDLSGNSGFCFKVWKALRNVHYGRTKSYKWLARKAGDKNCCRAAGNALGKNPLPVIIPCHRIIQSNGKPGGFSSGLNWKKRLLDLERGV